MALSAVYVTEPQRMGMFGSIGAVPLLLEVGSRHDVHEIAWLVDLELVAIVSMSGNPTVFVPLPQVFRMVARDGDALGQLSEVER